jgi:enoyl-CoA hydratase/carnithine racemase
MQEEHAIQAIGRKRMDLDEYAARYPNAKLERDDDGILEVTLHDGQGGPLKWGGSAHADLSLLFRNIAADTQNSVLVITGAGGHFIDGGKPGNFRFDKEVPSLGVDQIYREGKDLLASLLDVNVPVVAAIAGNVFPHAELALLSDIVIAADNAVIKDTHYEKGVVPGDGVHIVWTMLLGMNRGRYYLLTDEQISAAEALAWGLVGEVVPAGSELDRARELARRLALQPALVRRYTREVITLEIKRRLRDELGYGLALEGLASGYGNWR